MRKLKFDINIETNALLCPNPEEFYTKCYITEEIADNFRTLPGIKTATKIANVLFDDLLKASSCDFSADTQPLNAIDIDVVAFSAMAEICRFDLEQSFLSMSMVQGSNKEWAVAPFMAYYWDEMSKEINAEIAITRFQGNTGGTTSTYLDLVDGHEVKLLADATVVDVAATAITSANVIAEMAKVVTALDPCLQKRKDLLRFHVASDVALAYEIAAATNNTQANVTQSLGLSFIGIKMISQSGMTAGTMILTAKDNLIYAFDGEGDGTELEAIDLSKSVAEPKLRTRSNLKLGFYHINGSEIVYYS